MADPTPRSGPTIDLPSGRTARLEGIGLMCLAFLCFACLDATAKYLNGHMDTVQVVWARYAFALLVSTLILNPFANPGLLVTTRPGLQIARSAILLGSTAANFYALLYLQLDQTISINFSSPFLVAVMAGPLLGEWVGPRRMIAILVGFIGVLVVTRPGLGGLHWAFGLSFACALLTAVYALATRVLAGYDPPGTTLLYTSLIGVLMLSPVLPFVWTTPADLLDWGLMVLIGALGAIGHWFLILAHRRAPAAVLAPFIYTQLVWMILLGAVIFGDLPSAWTLTGAAIVIASGLYLLYRERTRTVPLPTD